MRWRPRQHKVPSLATDVAVPMDSDLGEDEDSLNAATGGGAPVTTSGKVGPDAILLPPKALAALTMALKTAGLQEPLHLLQGAGLAEAADRASLAAARHVSGQPPS